MYSGKKAQHDFPKMRGDGGGSKAVWNFSENSSVLEGECVPYPPDNADYRENADIQDNGDCADNDPARHVDLSYLTDLPTWHNNLDSNTCWPDLPTWHYNCDRAFHNSCDVYSQNWRKYCVNHPIVKFATLQRNFLPWLRAFAPSVLIAQANKLC